MLHAILPTRRRSGAMRVRPPPGGLAAHLGSSDTADEALAARLEAFTIAADQARNQKKKNPKKKKKKKKKKLAKKKNCGALLAARCRTLAPSVSRWGTRQGSR